MSVDPERLQEELKRMKERIASDPRVLARFDTDGNGVIDGEEWEAVRQLVIRRLQREAQEAEAARRLMEHLDDEQAAELARMEAEMAGETTQQPTAPSATTPGSGAAKERDWSNLELAFDPREERRKRSVADAIYEDELVARQSPSSRRAASVRLDEAGTLADRHELILEQTGGVKQLFGNMFRRGYVVRDRDGRELGTVGQRENEMIQNMTDFSILEDPDMHFAVQDHVANERFTLKRTSGIADNSIAVFNPRSMIVATTSWTISFVRRKYEVRVTRDGVSYYVQRRMLRPFTYDILDPFEEPIGVMERGWSGLGFLSGGNLFHLEVDADEVGPDAMWGFLATALLADLDAEKGSRGSFLDVFND